jgi:hypothetical protein
MPVIINGTTGVTTPDLTSTADISANNVPFGAGGGNVATNVAAGDGALNSNTTATRNVGVGYQAGYNNTTGQFNVLIGNQAGYRAAGVGSIGDASVFIGYTAGYSNQGNNNIGIGNGALYANTTGTFNIGVGVGAGNAITTGSKNTILGSFTGNQNNLDIRTASNRIVLSDGDGYPVFATYGSQGSIVLRTPAQASQTYAWQRMEGKAIVRGTSNGTGNLLTVGSYSGNNRVYVRVRYMATSAVSNACGAAVAYAYIDANSFGSNAVSSFTTENNVVGGMPSASLSWSSGTLQMTLSATSNYQGYITTVDVVQWDGNATITFNTSVEVFG